jgi:hypothetical protein
MAGGAQMAGAFDITLPADFDPDIHIIKVFAEQHNGDYQTDYASIPQVVEYLCPGYSVQTVYFGTNPLEGAKPSAWRVLKAGEGELFMLSANMVKVIFDDNIDTEFFYGNWEERNWLNGDYQQSFSAAELKAARPQKVLPDYGHKSEYQGSNEETVYDPHGDLFFLLSQEEALNPLYFPGGVADRIADYNWFLRSAGTHDVGCIDYVFDGYVCHNGYAAFQKDMGIRPACKLDLDSVALISPAVGGKSGGIGLLEPIKPQEQQSELKLTLLDEALAPDFTAQALTLSGQTFTVQYSGAVTGADKTVSAIVTDASGAANYYGKMAGGAQTAGAFTITLPEDFDPDIHTIKIFVEQHNGDYKTDYTSIPLTLEVALAAYTGH